MKLFPSKIKENVSYTNVLTKWQLMMFFFSPPYLNELLQDKKAFADILRRISKIQKANGHNYIVLREK